MKFNLKKTFYTTKFKVKKYSPEILLIGGIIGTVASAVIACTETTKINDIIDEKNESLKKIHEVNDRINDGEKIETKNNEIYTLDDIKKDTTIVYVQTGLKFVKLYAPSIILGTLSITSILASNNILKKRNAALAAAYAVLDRGFKEYRDRVVERFGEKVDHQLFHNLKEIEVEETVTDENGKEKKVKKTYEVPNGSSYSPYAKIFDDGNPNWDNNSDYNKHFIIAQQNFANDKLKAQGYLYLNDVYEMLGFKKTKAGQVVGWIYDEVNPNGNNYVDFGMFNIHNCSETEAERKSAFVNGYEESIVLDFNVDGNIWALMD